MSEKAKRQVIVRILETIAGKIPVTSGYVWRILGGDEWAKQALQHMSWKRFRTTILTARRILTPPQLTTFNRLTEKMRKKRLKETEIRIEVFATDLQEEETERLRNAFKTDCEHRRGMRLELILLEKKPDNQIDTYRGTNRQVVDSGNGELHWGGYTFLDFPLGAPMEAFARWMGEEIRAFMAILAGMATIYRGLGAKQAKKRVEQIGKRALKDMKKASREEEDDDNEEDSEDEDRQNKKRRKPRRARSKSRSSRRSSRSSRSRSKSGSRNKKGSGGRKKSRERSEEEVMRGELERMAAKQEEREAKEGKEAMQKLLAALGPEEEKGGKDDEGKPTKRRREDEKGGEKKGDKKGEETKVNKIKSILEVVCSELRPKAGEAKKSVTDEKGFLVKIGGRRVAVMC